MQSWSMVLYFSATGNTEFVARQCAQELQDECLNLLPKIKAGDCSGISSEKPFVICAPIYVCEMPRFFARFLKKLPLEGNRNVYFIFTSGGYSGCAGLLAQSLARKKKLHCMGWADVIMPRNYLATTLYAMQDKETEDACVRQAVQVIPGIASVIKSGGRLKSRHVYLFETLSILPLNPLWTRFMLTAKAFTASDACIACGLCERLCPLNNITLQEKRPVWGGSCTHCMACIANCPKEAIEYGTITQGKERYQLKKHLPQA